MPREFTTIAFSHNSPELIEQAKAKARSLHMSFSGYVFALIEKELQSRSSIRREATQDLESARALAPSTVIQGLIIR